MCTTLCYQHRALNKYYESVTLIARTRTLLVGRDEPSGEIPGGTSLICCGKALVEFQEQPEVVTVAIDTVFTVEKNAAVYRLH